jgi:hypothetical protein
MLPAMRREASRASKAPLGTILPPLAAGANFPSLSLELCSAAVLGSLFWRTSDGMEVRFKGKSGAAPALDGLPKLLALRQHRI